MSLLLLNTKNKPDLSLKSIVSSCAFDLCPSLSFSNNTLQNLANDSDHIISHKANPQYNQNTKALEFDNTPIDMVTDNKTSNFLLDAMNFYEHGITIFIHWKNASTLFSAVLNSTYSGQYAERIRIVHNYCYLYGRDSINNNIKKLTFGYNMPTNQECILCIQVSNPYNSSTTRNYRYFIDDMNNTINESNKGLYTYPHINTAGKLRICSVDTNSFQLPAGSQVWNISIFSSRLNMTDRNRIKQALLERKNG